MVVEVEELEEEEVAVVAPMQPMPVQNTCPLISREPRSSVLGGQVTGMKAELHPLRQLLSNGLASVLTLPLLSEYKPSLL